MSYDDTTGSADIQASAGLQAGWIYPLASPDRYWDEEDAERYNIDSDKKYSYARVPSNHDGADYYVMDMWIVDERGEIHPGYDECPVPIRKDDLLIERGRPLDGSTPKPRSIFGD